MKNKINSVSPKDIEGAVLFNDRLSYTFSLAENEIPNQKDLVFKIPSNDFAPKVKQDSLVLCASTKQRGEGLYLVLRGNEYCVEPKAPRPNGLTTCWKLDRIVSQILE